MPLHPAQHLREGVWVDAQPCGPDFSGSSATSGGGRDAQEGAQREPGLQVLVPGLHLRSCHCPEESKAHDLCKSMNFQSLKGIS